MGEPKPRSESTASEQPPVCRNPRHTDTYDLKDEGKKQSQTLAVHEPKTILHLGEWLSDPNEIGWDEKFGFPGISMKTSENFFVKAKESAVFDVGEDVTFRSGKGWTQFSQTLDVAVKQKMMMASGHSMIIAAGPTDTYAGPPDSGRDLHPPTFDRGTVHSLVLGHLVKRDKFLKEVADAKTELGNVLGQTIPVDKEAELTGYLVSLYTTLDNARELRRKFHGVVKIAQALPHLLEADSAVLHYDRAMKDYREFDLHRGLEPAREEEEAADSAAEGLHALVGEDSPLSKDALTISTYASTVDVGLNFAEREVERTKSRAADLRSRWSELSEGEEKNSFKAWIDWAKALSELATTFLADVDSYCSEVLNLAAGLAATATQKIDEPRLIAAAKADLLLLAGEEIGAYAKEGFQLQSDEGPFDLSTHGPIRAHTFESAEITAATDLLLAAKQAAELTCEGPVYIGSRKDFRGVEILGKSLTLGALDPAKAMRADKRARGPVSTGAVHSPMHDPMEAESPLATDWDEEKQEATQVITGAATHEVLLQAGGETTTAHKPLVESAPAGGLRLSGQKDKESAELWSTGKILIEADEPRGEVRLSVGNFLVVLNKDTAAVGLATRKNKTPDKAFLTIDSKGVIRLASETAHLHLSKQAGFLRHGKTDAFVKVANSGTKISGSQIDIG